MKKIILQLLVCSILQVLANDLSKNSISLLLPVNWMQKNKKNISFSIPKGFSPIQSMEECTIHNANGVRIFIEAIPSNESSKKWTEIITCLSVVGKGISATQVVTDTKKSITSQSETKEILIDVLEKQEDGYRTAKSAHVYSYNGQLEAIYMVAYSGPADYVMIQYTKKLSPDYNKIELLKEFKSKVDENVTLFS